MRTIGQFGIISIAEAADGNLNSSKECLKMDWKDHKYVVLEALMLCAMFS